MHVSCVLIYSLTENTEKIFLVFNLEILLLYLKLLLDYPYPPVTLIRGQWKMSLLLRISLSKHKAWSKHLKVKIRISLSHLGSNCTKWRYSIPDEHSNYEHPKYLRLRKANVLQRILETQFLIGQQEPGMCSICNPSTGESKAGHCEVHHQTELNSKHWANLSYKVKVLPHTADPSIN